MPLDRDSPQLLATVLVAIVATGAAAAVIADVVGTDDTTDDAVAESGWRVGNWTYQSYTASADSPFGGDGAVNRTTFTIRAGTEQATPVYVIDAERDGPTAMVVAGIHGDEISAYRAGNRVKDWRIDRGTLVVIPEANRYGIEEGIRWGKWGDYNRHFPAGEEPTSPLATAIWTVVDRYDPDFLLDVHSSNGLSDPNRSVGQILDPSYTGDAANASETVAAFLNEHYVTAEMPELWQFETIPSGADGGRPMLKEKIAADRDTPAVIMSVYDKPGELIPISQQIEWVQAATHRYLEYYGLIDPANRPIEAAG